MNKTVYRIFYVATMASAAGGFLAVASGRVPLAIGLWVVTLACLGAIVGTAVSKARPQLADRAKAEVGDVVAGPDAPSPLPTVLAALEELNGPDIPFSVSAEPSSDGAVVTVRWRLEELRWKSLFTDGTFVYNWKMVVKLDASAARYGFLERQSQARYQQGVWPPQVNWAWRGFWGKTASQRKVHIVMVPGGSVETSTQGMDGPRTDWVGAVSIRPADAKIPVLTTLRNHGWRPRVDWFGARLFER